jgi:hypothetical protein
MHGRRMARGLGPDALAESVVSVSDTLRTRVSSRSLLADDLLSGGYLSAGSQSLPGDIMWSQTSCTGVDRELSTSYETVS